MLLCEQDAEYFAVCFSLPFPSQPAALDEHSHAQFHHDTFLGGKKNDGENRQFLPRAFN